MGSGRPSGNCEIEYDSKEEEKVSQMEKRADLKERETRKW